VIKLRIRATKLGKVRFTSHRDAARLWERALRRADLPVAASEGFTPRPKISFGLALPTGAESTAEYVDVDLREPGEQRRHVGIRPDAQHHRGGHQPPASHQPVRANVRGGGHVGLVGPSGPDSATGHSGRKVAARRLPVRCSALQSGFS